MCGTEARGMKTATRIIGLDPGLNYTGWGVVESQGSRLRYVACGRIHNLAASHAMSSRLAHLFSGLTKIIESTEPDEAAVEETFVNKNAASALKLGMARGVVMLAPAQLQIPVFEYAANLVKKAVSGYGHADKSQVGHMIKILLPQADLSTPDAADALAVAVCHAHYRGSRF